MNNSHLDKYSRIYARLSRRKQIYHETENATYARLITRLYSLLLSTVKLLFYGCCWERVGNDVAEFVFKVPIRRSVFELREYASKIDFRLIFLVSIFCENETTHVEKPLYSGFTFFSLTLSSTEAEHTSQLLIFE